MKKIPPFDSDVKLNSACSVGETANKIHSHNIFIYALCSAHETADCATFEIKKKRMAEPLQIDSDAVLN